VSRPARVEALASSDAEEVVSVLAEAFTDYPVMRYVLGTDSPAELERLVRMFVMARVFRGEPLLGVHDGSGLAAAGIVSFPGDEPPPPAFLALRRDTWRELGPEAERRYTDYGGATWPFPFPAGSVHLNKIGVRRAHQRSGLGRSIIDAVQEISRARPGSRGVSLTTEQVANVDYYSSLGFELVGHAQVGPGLESWGFFRRDVDQ
jgi:hypothetical protein